MTEEILESNETQNVLELDPAPRLLPKWILLADLTLESLGQASDKD